jgi:apolipoprotein D and lipocalin family protein
MAATLSLWIMAVATATVAPQATMTPPRLAQVRVVESIDLARYAGQWFEIARLPHTRQDPCAADVIARYTQRADGRLDVVNSCRTGGGKVLAAHGIGRRAGKDSSARLQVRFAPAILSIFPNVWGDYWIIGLGPEYSWAVVGVPGREHLWILSRTPEMSAASYQQALAIARGNGFDVSRLITTTQNAR